MIVPVKSFATREAITAAAPHLKGAQTVVMSLQNGLGHEDILADVVGRDKVMAGKTHVGGVFVEPGRVIAGTRGKLTVIGELDGSVSRRARAIAAEFAGMVCEVIDDIVGTMWDKLLINVATGAVTAITGLTCGAAYELPGIEATAVAAVAAGRPGQMIDRPGVPPGWRCPPSNSLCSLANSCASGTPGSR